MTSPYGGQDVSLVPGTLRGYRHWQPTQSNKLASLTMHYTWEQSTVAGDCLRAQHDPWFPGAGTYAQGGVVSPSGYVGETGPVSNPDHRVPVRRCTCGIYAKHLPEPYGADSYVAGVVEAWGLVELGSEGFRSEKARIIALAMPRIIRKEDYAEFMHILGQSYEGVKFYPTNEAMYEAFPPVDVSTLVPAPKDDEPEILKEVRYMMNQAYRSWGT